MTRKGPMGPDELLLKLGAAIFVILVAFVLLLLMGAT